MGHLFRTLNVVTELQHRKTSFIVYINKDEVSERILQQTRVPFRVVNLNDTKTEWEIDLIHQDGITVWVNDRLDTKLSHAISVKSSNIRLVTFDDRGSGASLADVNVASLVFDEKINLKGNQILRGTDYLVLNPKIAENTRVRKNLNSLLVTLGGTDTYGVTVKVVNILKHRKVPATIIVGPGFSHWEPLYDVLDSNFSVKHNIPSLIEEFYHHDLAITGGGITPFEANASGLPCIVIANETFEASVGEKLQSLGGSVYAGFHKNFEIPSLACGAALKNMSLAGIQFVGTNGTKNVVDMLLDFNQ